MSKCQVKQECYSLMNKFELFTHWKQAHKIYLHFILIAGWKSWCVNSRTFIGQNKPIKEISFFLRNSVIRLFNLTFMFVSRITAVYVLFRVLTTGNGVNWLVQSTSLRQPDTLVQCPCSGTILFHSRSPPTCLKRSSDVTRGFWTAFRSKTSRCSSPCFLHTVFILRSPLCGISVRINLAMKLNTLQ